MKNLHGESKVQDFTRNIIVLGMRGEGGKGLMWGVLCKFMLV